MTGILGVADGEVDEVAGDWCPFETGLDHHSFCTGQVYKPGPDLHKALQPSKRKE